ncbi:MAG: hypothetical protein KCHDKBKB_01204 [Elusimicrobia bacterium]|nr:hypothetical protein [Elusimicrobiota bacterium]
MARLGFVGSGGDAAVEYPLDLSHRSEENLGRHQFGVAFWGLGVHFAHAALCLAISRNSTQGVWYQQCNFLYRSCGSGFDIPEKKVKEKPQQQ